MVPGSIVSKSAGERMTLAGAVTPGAHREALQRPGREDIPPLCLETGEIERTESVSVVRRHRARRMESLAGLAPGATLAGQFRQVVSRPSRPWRRVRLLDLGACEKEDIVRRVERARVRQSPPQFVRETPQRRPGRADVEERLVTIWGELLGPLQQSPKEEPAHGIEGALGLGYQPLAFAHRRVMPRSSGSARLRDYGLEAQQDRQWILEQRRLGEVEGVDLMAKALEVAMQAVQRGLPVRRVRQRIEEGAGRRGSHQRPQLLILPDEPGDALEIRLGLERLRGEPAQVHGAGQPAPRRDEGEESIEDTVGDLRRADGHRRGPPGRGVRPRELTHAREELLVRGGREVDASPALDGQEVGGQTHIAPEPDPGAKDGGEDAH
jgi:hypothetical protein